MYAHKQKVLQKLIQISWNARYTNVTQISWNAHLSRIAWMLIHISILTFLQVEV